MDDPTHEEFDAQQAVRPDLIPYPLADALRERRERLSMTMTRDEWDGTLAAAYDSGLTLIEVDGDGAPLSAYRMTDIPIETTRRFAAWQERTLRVSRRRVEDTNPLIWIKLPKSDA